MVSGIAPKVVFGNGQELYLHQPLHFHSEAGQKPLERTQLAPEESYPTPNLPERAARATGLTRPTLNRIYVGLPERKKRLLLQLVRETKGGEDPRQLQFAHEQQDRGRQAPLSRAGRGLCVVTDQTMDWWEADEEHGS
jgi:hypothetical protein